MIKFDDYQKELLNQSDQEKYLKSNSCLPGLRSDLELLYAFIDVSHFCCAIAACSKHILKGKKVIILSKRQSLPFFANLKNNRLIKMDKIWAEELITS